MEHFALAGSTGHRSTLGRSFHWFESGSGETTLRISKLRSDGHALAYSSSRHFNDGVRPDLVLRNITHDIVSISSTVPLTQGVGAGLHVLWVPQNYWSGIGLHPHGICESCSAQWLVFKYGLIVDAQCVEAVTRLHPR